LSMAGEVCTNARAAAKLWFFHSRTICVMLWSRLPRSTMPAAH
jgi:hypothetical protein